MEYYNETIAKNDSIDVIHINRDRSPDAMVKFIGDMKMPWPAVLFEKRGDFKIAMDLYRRAVPQYTMVDAEGKILADGLAAVQAKVKELTSG